MRTMIYDIAEDWELENFYLTKDLNEKRIEVLDKVLKGNSKTLRQFNRRIQETAEMRGRESKEIILRDGQVVPMLMSLVTRRFFIGDEPGLGKTVMSAASYANYVYHELRRGRTPTKIIVVTTSSHVNSFADEWSEYGIYLLPLTKGSDIIERTFMKNDTSEYDGLIINWDGLKTNAFLDHYMRNHEDYNYMVLDETGVLKKDKSDLYKVVEQIVNKYKDGVERVLFLNGSSFESNVFDFYYQFKVLKPKLIPNKQFIEDNYVIRGGASYYAMNQKGAKGGQRNLIRQYMGEIEGYKNAGELRERLKYYYIARSKADFSSELPKKNYIMHLVEMTPKQRKMLREERSSTIINSPPTRDDKLKMTLRNAPKLNEVVEFADKTHKDRPLIYVYNIESQKVMKRELKKLGYRVEIINGNVKPEDKTEIVKRFNNYELDMLVFNIKRAISIPTSDRILFYDIPIMPHETKQLIGRIDRNNYDIPKFYDFFCYLESPEMDNIIRLSLFRETSGNEFTGQESYVYQSIIDQLSTHYGRDVMDTVKERSETDEDFFDSDEWMDLVDEIV